MPISGPSSYPPTVREFVEHWLAVNEFLGVSAELVLAGDILVTTLTTYRDDLDTLRDLVTDAGVDRVFAREQLNGLITQLQGRLVEFNDRVRADLAGTAYARALRDAFAVGDGESAVREGMRAMARLWTKINAITPAPPGVALPLVLLGSYTLAVLTADLESLRLAYQALTDADVELQLARGNRNDMQDNIYSVLKAYRMKVPTALPAGNALRDTLPALSPPEGHTPEPVAVTGVWQASTTEAKVTWEASEDAELREYQVRGVPGDDYVTEDEVTLATVLPGAPLELLTDFALGSPGAIAGFKVYVVLTTGRERGSEPVFVTRSA